jgi:hypothetical protein
MGTIRKIDSLAGAITMDECTALPEQTGFEEIYYADLDHSMNENCCFMNISANSVTWLATDPFRKHNRDLRPICKPAITSTLRSRECVRYSNPSHSHVGRLQPECERDLMTNE